MQEASFKEFISRPENKPGIEAHQQQEVQELVTLSERLQLQEASSKVRSRAGAHAGCVRSCRVVWYQAGCAAE